MPPLPYLVSFIQKMKRTREYADNRTGNAGINGYTLRPGPNALHNKIVC